MESALFHGRPSRDGRGGRADREARGGEGDRGSPSRDWIDTLMNEKKAFGLYRLSRKRKRRRKRRAEGSARARAWEIERTLLSPPPSPPHPGEAIMSSAVARNCLRFASASGVGVSGETEERRSSKELSRNETKRAATALRGDRCPVSPREITLSRDLRRDSTTRLCRLRVARKSTVPT